METLIPCFGLPVTPALSFKARVEFLLTHFLACMLFLTFTSGATPGDCFEVSIAVEPFRSMCLQTCPQVSVELVSSVVVAHTDIFITIPNSVFFTLWDDLEHVTAETI